MTDAEKLTALKSLLDIADNSEDGKLTAYLTLSANEILAWRYSQCTEVPETVPSEYETTQIFAVVAGYSQSGAENQIRHNENGIHREFRHSDMVAYIRANVIPFVGVF